MANDGGVWARLPQPNNGGGIWTKTSSGWVEIGGGSGGLEWGDFTTNGDETTSDTWGPDADGRMWKWAEWNVADDYTVNLTGGLYHVLCVNGGDGGGQSQQYGNQGQPGLVREGYWQFTDNPATVITVGKKGSADPNILGQWSGVGDRISGFSTQAANSWGQAATGRGGLSSSDPTGYKSFIAGEEREFSPGTNGAQLPGKSGTHAAKTQEDGCVIIATAAPNAKALNWVHTTYHAEVNDGLVTAVHTQKHYADGTTTPLPTAELVDATYGVSEGWLFVDGELQPPPPPPEPTLKERIEALQQQIKDLQKDT